MNAPSKKMDSPEPPDEVLIASREVRAVFEHASLGIALSRNKVIPSSTPTALSA